MRVPFTFAASSRSNPQLAAIKSLWETRAGEDGSALIEFALTLPVLCVIFAGVVNYALFLVAGMQVQEAATAGATYATSRGQAANTTGIQTAARNSAPSITNLTVTATNIYECTPGGAQVPQNASCSTGKTPLRYVQVTTSAPAPPRLNFPGVSPTLQLSGSAMMPGPWAP